MGGRRGKRERTERHRQALTEQIEDPEAYGVRVSCTSIFSRTILQFFIRRHLILLHEERSDPLICAFSVHSCRVLLEKALPDTHLPALGADKAEE